MPFINGGWKASKLRMVFAFAHVVGLVVGAVLIFGGGPASYRREHGTLPAQ